MKLQGELFFVSGGWDKWGGGVLLYLIGQLEVYSLKKLINKPTKAYNS